MLKLMKLEMRKFQLWSYNLAVIMINIVIFGLMCVITMIPEIKSDLPISSYDSAFTLIDTLVRLSYIVFAAVLISRIVVDEFRNKSISILFLYPISRKKLIAAKLLVVVLFTFAAATMTNVLVGAGFYLLNIYTEIVAEPFTWIIATQSLLKVMMSALATSFLSLIPLYFGLRKYSVSATIVSSLFIAVLVNQSVAGFTLFSVIGVPIGLSLLGIIIAYISIYNIEKVDVLK